MAAAGRSGEARCNRNLREGSATMAIEAERDPRLYAVDDDPMRATAIRNGRPRPAIADPAPLGGAEAEEHLLGQRLERLAVDQRRARRTIEARLGEQLWSRYA
jgi:hypothetical protein